LFPIFDSLRRLATTNRKTWNFGQILTPKMWIFPSPQNWGDDGGTLVAAIKNCRGTATNRTMIAIHALASSEIGALVKKEKTRASLKSALL